MGKEGVDSHMNTSLGCVKDLLHAPMVSGNHHLDARVGHGGYADDGTGQNEKQGDDEQVIDVGKGQPFRGGFSLPDRRR